MSNFSGETSFYHAQMRHNLVHFGLLAWNGYLFNTIQTTMNARIYGWIHFLILCLGFGQLANAQTTTLDSLLQVYESSDKDSIKAEIAYRIVNEVRKESLPNSFIWIKALDSLSNLSSNPRFTMLTHKAYSYHYQEIGSEDTALIHNYKFLEAAEILNDSALIVEAYNHIGNSYNNMNDDQNALDNLLIATEIANRNGFLREAIECYNTMSNIMITNDMDASIGYLKKAEELAVEFGEPFLLGKIYVNLSILHDDDNKLDYGLKAVKIAEDNDLKAVLFHAYNSLGDYYVTDLAGNDYEHSLDYKRKSLKLAEQLGFGGKIAVFQKSIANAFLLNNQPDSAEFYLRKVLDYAKDDREEYLYFESLRMFSNAKYMQEDFQIAFDSLESSYALSKRYYRENLEKKVIDANKKFETEEKQKQLIEQELEIEKQKSSRNRTLFISLAVLIISLFLFLYYFQRLNRKKKEAELKAEIEKEKSDNLEELASMKNQFFTNISHELRTPLTLISDPLRKVLESPENNDLNNDIKLAYNNSKRLLDMINQIMDLSKLEAGETKVVQESIQVNSYLKRLFFAFESFAKVNQVDLKFHSLLSDQKHIQTDPNHLERIINNLVSNAIKFSPAGGKVELDLSFVNEALIISVQDQGPGLSASEIEKIWERFYQVDQGINFKGGTGVGLALTKELVQQIGATIDVQSEKNNGSKFIVHVPTKLLEHDENIVEETIGSSEQAYIGYTPLLINGDKPRILIIEDNLEMLEYLNKLLIEAYNITLASNGNEGLSAIAEHQFDLIVSDIMLPDMDGFTIRRNVRNQKNLVRTPYVFLTARSLEEDILEGLMLGVDDYITKPFNSDELKARIYNLIKNKIEREAWQSENDPIFSEDSEDLKFLKVAEKTVFQKISDVNFKVQDLAQALNLSSRQVNRKLKPLTGYSAVEFILELRLQKAKQLLDRKIFRTLNEVRYEVGIDSASYFSRKFKERFGRSPSEWVK